MNSYEQSVIEAATKRRKELKLSVQAHFALRACSMDSVCMEIN